MLELLSRAYTYILEDIHENLLPYLKQKKITKISCRYGLVFEDFFDDRRKKLRSEGKTEVYYELIGQIEQWVTAMVHAISKGTSLEDVDFVANILTELSVKYDNLKSPIEIIDPVEISPSPYLNSQVILAGVKKMEDIANLVSAITFQFKNNTWVVFVTFDEEHILSCRLWLKEIFALHCSKPAYASDHLVRLSGMPKPVQFYRSIKNHTVQQKKFAKAVDNAIQIKII